MNNWKNTKDIPLKEKLIYIQKRIIEFSSEVTKEMSNQYLAKFELLNKLKERREKKCRNGNH